MYSSISSSQESLPFSSLITSHFTNNSLNIFDLQELNYFPYNSCNSLTIYSYKYWKTQNSFLLSTKENNLKEINFNTCSQFSDRICTNNKKEFKKCVPQDTTEDSNSEAKEKVYLEPSFKVHKFPRIKSTNY
jgi:hypothetical protein